MTTWILIFVITGMGKDGWDGGVATGTAVFHSQAACLQASAKFRKSYCFEDRYDVKESTKNASSEGGLK